MKPVFRIRHSVRFEAAHHLSGLPGSHPCTRPHGHSYRVEFELEAAVLDENGMVMEFGFLDSVVRGLDHRDLNEVMVGANPTAENIAKLLFDAANHGILQMDAQDDVRVRRVLVWETPESCAEFIVVP